MTCQKRRNLPDEWTCDRCMSLWFGELAKTDWRPTACLDRTIELDHSRSDESPPAKLGRP